MRTTTAHSYYFLETRGSERGLRLRVLGEAYGYVCWEWFRCGCGDGGIDVAVVMVA